MVTLDEFRKSASPEQISILNNIVSLVQNEEKAYDKYIARQSAIDDAVARIKYNHGLQSNLIDAELELIVDPMLPLRDSYLHKLEDTKKRIKEAFIKAVKSGMGHLGFIQRNYEAAVGKPLPMR